MATIDLRPLLQKAMKEQMEVFKEELRVLQEEAWDSGYIAADNGVDETANPFRKGE